MSMMPDGMRTTGIDISFVAVEQSRASFPKPDYLVADAVHLPFASREFRTIVCSEVIEHIGHPDSALAEFHRLLDIGGTLILTTPNWFSLYGLARAVGRLLLGRDFTAGNQPYDKWYTKKSLETKLRQASFRAQKWFGIWFFPPFGKGEKYRLPDRILVPLVRALMPLDRALRPRIPSLGHITCVVSVKRRQQGLDGCTPPNYIRYESQDRISEL
jgi:2-polyprenyl-3-methyl-5-hydroxy-6-metoxy-1,4-benzoquinol methylase